MTDCFTMATKVLFSVNTTVNYSLNYRGALKSQKYTKLHTVALKMKCVISLPLVATK